MFEIGATDLSLRNPMCVVKETDPLSVAVAHFAQGVHRVCVVGPEGKVSAILSQSAVARWLEANVCIPTSFALPPSFSSNTALILQSATPMFPACCDSSQRHFMPKRMALKANYTVFTRVYEVASIPAQHMTDVEPITSQPVCVLVPD